MATLLTRIVLLERKSAKLPAVFQIICKGAQPNSEEQAQIDEAEKRGMFVICRVIVAHPKLTFNMMPPIETAEQLQLFFL